MKIACVLLPDFEVAVELSRHPDLVSRPVVVGGLPHERKTVCSCSPEAAAFGIVPGMPLRQACGLCPEAAFLPLDEGICREVFCRVLRVLDCFSPAIEAAYPPQSSAKNASQDVGAGRRARPGPSSGRRANNDPSALASWWLQDPLLAVYLDAAGLESLFGPDEELGRRMASSMGLEAGLHPQVGLGGNKFVARMAAQKAGAGQATVVRKGDESTFLAPLPVEQLPCSPETLRRLQLLGLRTLGQLARLPAGAMAEQFGSEGAGLQRLARGVDRRPLLPREVPPLLDETAEINPPTVDSAALLFAASALIQKLVARMRSDYLVCREVILQVGFAGGSTSPLSTTLHERTDREDDLMRAVARLLNRLGSSPVAAGFMPAHPRSEADCCPAGLHAPAKGATTRSVHNTSPRLSFPPSPRLSVSPPVFPSVPPPPTERGVSSLRLALSSFGGHQGEQLELFGSRAGNLRKVQRALQEMDEQFGEKSFQPLAELDDRMPAGIPLGVITGDRGEPQALILGGKRERVLEVCNRWRVEDDWWRRDVRRDYYRLITESGKLWVVYRDLTPSAPFPASGMGDRSPLSPRGRGLGVGSSSPWFLERIYG